jgi:transcriptional regulator with XRE-family HTH domain
VSQIAKLRERKGLTQKQLADLLDTTVTTVANWERGRTGLKEFKRVADLCRALGCRAEDLIAESVDSVKN